MFKVIKLNKFPILFDCLDLRHPPQQYEARNNESFPRTESIRANFLYQFINIWNSIPIHITNQPSLSKFKAEYTQHLLSNY